MTRRRHKSDRAPAPLVDAPPTPGAPTTGGALLLPGLIVAVMAAVAAAHWPALDAQALYFDDYQYMQTNPLVQQPGWESARRFLNEVVKPSTVRGYYQPLTMISLMGDWALGGRPDHLRPFHRTSLILHVVNTALVILLLYLLFRQPVVAALAGLLFGLHPITVEPIPWVGERKTLLAAFFALWTLITYVLYTRRGNLWAYAACIVAYLLALLSKPTATPLPVLLLLLDVWPLGRLRRGMRPARGALIVLEKAPLAAIGLLSATITIWSQGQFGLTAPGEHPPGFVPYVLCHNIIFYLQKLLWPVGLDPHYSFPEPFDLSDPAIALGVVGTPLLIAALIAAWRWTRAPLIGWLFFFLSLLPTTGIVGFTIVVASDKYAYFPMVGLLLILAAALLRGWSTGHPGVRGTLIAATLVLGGLEFAQTRRTLEPWRDTESIYRHALASSRPTYRLRHNLALELLAQGRESEAIAEFERALELNPQHANSLNELGEIQRKRGERDAAVRLFEAALQADPGFVAARNNLGLVYFDRRQYADALAAYDEVLRLRPQDWIAWMNKGNALRRLDRLDEAIAAYRESLRLRPHHARTYLNLGLALRSAGRLDEAEAALQTALRLQPGYEAAQRQLEQVQRQRGTPAP